MPPQSLPDASAALPAVGTSQDAGLDLDWPGATERDERLAAEVVGLAREAFASLLPADGAVEPTRVRVVVADAPQPVGSAYLLVSREVRIERRFLDRLNLAHETSHALLHGRLGFPPPVWFDEAVAQLVAYRVVHGKDLAPPPGRPIGDFARLRALHGAAWQQAGPPAYADAALWLGWLLPSGPAPDAEKAAFARWYDRLVRERDAAACDSELSAVDRGSPP